MIRTTAVTLLALLMLMGAATPLPPSNRELVRAMFDAFNRHDAAAVASIYAKATVVYSPDACAPTRGRAAVEASYAKLFNEMPDVQNQIDTIISEDNQVAVRFTATSKELDNPLPIAAFLKFLNSEVIEERVFYDTGEAQDCD